MSDDDKSEVLAIVGVTIFGALFLGLGFVFFASGHGPKDGAGRVLALLGACAILMGALAVFLRGPFSRWSAETRGMVVGFGLLATIPVWIWILFR